MNKKDADELEEFLNSAHGTLTITLNGMTPNVKGTCNDSGAILAAFSGLKILESQSGNDFEEVLSLMRDLQQVMGYEIFNRSAQ